jgi:hypothetical protein
MPRPVQYSKEEAAQNTKDNKKKWQIANREKYLQSMREAYKKRQEKKKELNQLPKQDLIYISMSQYTGNNARWT